MTQSDIEKIIIKLEEEKEKTKTWHSELSAVDYCFDKAIEIVKESVKDKEITKEIYEKNIPKNCKRKTFEAHKEMMYCWGLLSDIQKGIFKDVCTAKCDFNEKIK